MSNYLIPRSQAALKVELWVMYGVTVFTALLSLLLVRFFYHASSSTRWHSGLLTLIIILLLGQVMILFRQKKWKDISYKLAPESIIVNQATSNFSTTQEIYLYESIISATMTQGYFGKKYNYGDVVLVIPKLGSSIRLKSLADPTEQLNMLKSHLKNKADRRNLVT